MSGQKYEDLIKALIGAYQTNQPLMILEYAHLLRDFDHAYHIQAAVTAAKNEPICGYKLSLTKKVLQTIIGIPEPFYGPQIQSRLHKTPAQLRLNQLNEPMIGATLMFTAKTDLNTGLSDQALLQQLQIAGGLEIIDSRFAHWFPALNKYLILADCCLAGYMIYGHFIDGTQVSVNELAHISTELTLNEQCCAKGQTADDIDHPLQTLQWFLNKLHQHRQQWRRGQVVSSGILFMLIPMSQGEYCAHFSHAGLRSVLLNIDP